MTGVLIKVIQLELKCSSLCKLQRCKVIHVDVRKAYRGSRSLALLSLNLVVRWTAVYNAPAALVPGKNPGTHCTGGWVGPAADLGDLEKRKRLANAGI